ncbi:MAG TPA: hypothetical protein VID29_04525 [Solirubrobacteraceae bacterium]|jgi:hypothetical protein
MRPGLPHPIAERRRARRAGAPSRRAPRKQDSAALVPPTAPGSPGAADELTVAHRPDIAAQRVREAGGPIDRASYVCLCGFVFAAAVSTSVECPHCGAAQAW